MSQPNRQQESEQTLKAIVIPSNAPYLQIGDIIQTDKLSSRDVILQIEGRSKFAGKIGQFRGKRALKIVRHTAPSELA